MSDPSAAARPPSEFRLGWKVLLAALLGTAFGASPIPFQTTGFFMGPLQQEFGWSLSQISLGLTIYGVLGALLAPFYGSLADRHGVRPVALGALAVFGLVFACFSLTPSLPVFYMLWTLVGLVGIGSTPLTWSRAIGLWFFRSRGLALGLTLIGTSITAILLPPLTAWLIGSYGWRISYAAIALLPLCVALPVGLLLFREPRPEERPPELAIVDSDGRQVLAGFSLKECTRNSRFWVLIASTALVSFAYAGGLVHLPQILKGAGFTPAQVAPIMSVWGAAIFFGRIGSGLLLDRFWAPLVMLPILSMPALGCYMLTNDSLGYGAAVVAAVLFGLSSGAETDLIAYLAGRYFGMAHYGKIYGVVYMTFGIGSALSPMAYAAVRDTTGSYDLILFVCAGMFVTGALLLLTMGRYPNFGTAGGSGHS